MARESYEGGDETEISVQHFGYDGKRLLPSWVLKKELDKYLRDPESVAPPKEILQASKPAGHVAYVCTVNLSDIILSAETAALEDGAISILQHRSIRSILSTAANVYCFGVAGMGKKMPCPHCALAQ